MIHNIAEIRFENQIASRSDAIFHSTLICNAPLFLYEQNFMAIFLSTGSFVSQFFTLPVCYAVMRCKLWYVDINAAYTYIPHRRAVEFIAQLGLRTVERCYARLVIVKVLSINTDVNVHTSIIVYIKYINRQMARATMFKPRSLKYFTRNVPPRKCQHIAHWCTRVFANLYSVHNFNVWYVEKQNS